MNPTAQTGVKIVIHWQTKNEESISLIRKRFGIPQYTTINGQTPALLNPEDRPIFDETARRGYFSYDFRDWTFNGMSYSW